MKRTVLLPLFLLCTALSFCQSDTSATGTVCIMRSTGFTGSARKYKLFMDERLLCKIPNNSYVKISVPVGEHAFAVQTNGTSLWPATERIAVTLQSGKTSYLSVAMAMGMVDTRLNLNEVAEKNAASRMGGLKQAACGND